MCRMPALYTYEYGDFRKLCKVRHRVASIVEATKKLLKTCLRKNLRRMKCKTTSSKPNILDGGQCASLLCIVVGKY